MHTASHKKLFFLALFSCLLVIALVSLIPLTMYNDPAQQIKALQDYLSGRSPSLNQRNIPLNSDLSRDTLEWLFWWPPGLQAIACPFMAGGLPVGDTLRIIAAVSLIVGSLGWVRWFLLFSLPFWMKVVFVLGLPWIRYANNPLFTFSSECLVYAVVPWLLLAAQDFTGTMTQKGRYAARTMAVAVGFGLCLASVYLLKYSAVFVPLGILVYAGIAVYRLSRGKDRHSLYPAAISLVLAAAFFLLPVAALNLINYRLSAGMNPVTSRPGVLFFWDGLVLLCGMPGLAIADAESMWAYYLLHPVSGLLRNYPWFSQAGGGDCSFWIALIGLPGSLLIFWLIRYSRVSFAQLPAPFNEADVPRGLALSVFFTGLAGMFCAGIFSGGNIAYPARYLAVESMAVLPVVLRGGLSAWGHYRSRMLRLSLACAAIAYLVMPLIYGGVSVVGKIKRFPKGYISGPSRLYNPRFSDHDIAGARKDLLRNFDITKDIWYIPDSVSALDLPGRAIIREAVFSKTFELKRDRFTSAIPLRVFVLLPPELEKNGRAKLVRGSFLQAGKWRSARINGCKYALWTSTLGVTPGVQK